MPSPLADLLSSPACALLDALPPTPPALARALGDRLRRGGTAPHVAAALASQAQLRWEATAKLGEAARQMVFTRVGLEQASRLVVAAHHAARFRAAGCRHVADLGCGLGVDSLALAGLGLEVSAVEVDPDTAVLARHNLRAFPEARVITADAVTLDLRALGVDGIFADPARRTGAGRVSDPSRWSPPLHVVLGWSGIAPLGVKVAPGIRYTDLPSDAEAQWVSVDGDVVEAGLWCGPLATSPGRSALVIAGESAHVLRASVHDPRQPAEQADAARTLGDVLIEPDGAVIRAGALADLARSAQAAPVFPGIAYLTGAHPLPPSVAAFGTSWRVEEVVSLKPKKLKDALRSWGCGDLVIKKRGVDLDPDALRRQVLPRPAGNARVTLICTRLASRRVAIRVRPLEAS